MGETAIRQEQICTGTGIAGGAFAQDQGAWWDCGGPRLWME